MAGQIGSGEQGAVVEAAADMQVGAVVPLAHAFLAQPDLQCIQRAGQARIGACCVFFCLGGRLRAWRRADAQTGFLECQLFIEAVDAGNAGQGAQGGLACGVVAGQCQVGACAPVNPGAVIAQCGGHGGNGALHHAPVASAQRSAGGPGQVLFMHLAELALAEIADRIGGLFLCGAPTDGAPEPAAGFRRQLGLPAQLAQLLGRLFWVLVGQAQDGQRDEFTGLRLQCREFFLEIAFRRAVDFVDGFEPAVVEQAYRLGDDTQAVVFHAQAGALPDGGGRQQALRVKLSGHVAAGFFGVAQRQPGLGQGVGDVGLAGGVVGQQAVTADRLVVAHAVAWQFALEGGPVVVAAELLQQIDAQAVFLVGVGKAAEKFLDFDWIGFIEPARQFPVGGPGLQNVAAQLRQQVCQAFAVPILVGLRHLGDGIVKIGAVAPLGVSGGIQWQYRGAQKGQRCQNG